MKNLFKLMTFAIILVLLFTLTSCTEKEEEEVEEVAPIVNITDEEIYDEMLAVSTVPASGKYYPSKITAYIGTKAESLGLEMETDESGNIIVFKPASSGMESAPVTVLECGLYSPDTTLPKLIRNTATGSITSDGGSLAVNRNAGIATILCILKDVEIHGPIRAIFTVDKNPTFENSSNLSAAYLQDAANLIGFSGTNGINTYISAPSAQMLESNLQAEAVPTKGKYAYVIAASGFPHNGSSDIPNPVKVISDLLTQAKAGGLYYELSSLSAGSAPLLSPTEAVAVVVFDDYEMKRFKTLFDEFDRQFMDSLPAQTEQIKLQLIQTRVPGDVLSDEAQSNVIAYLYGVLNNMNSGDGSANISIYDLSLSHGTLLCKMAVASEAKEKIDQIIENQSSIAGFSAIPLAVTGEVLGFKTKDSSPVATSLNDNLSAQFREKKKSLSLNTISELSVLASKNEELSTISLGWETAVNADGKEYLLQKSVAAPANAIVDFLLNE